MKLISMIKVKTEYFKNKNKTVEEINREIISNMNIDFLVEEVVYILDNSMYWDGLNYSGPDFVKLDLAIEEIVMRNADDVNELIKYLDKIDIYSENIINNKPIKKIISNALLKSVQQIEGV